MEILINGEKIDFTLENEKTIGDVFTAFETNMAENDATTTGIELNGEKIYAEQYDSILAQPIEENTRINFKVISRQEIEAQLKSSSKNLREIAPKLTTIPSELQSGKEKEANQRIAELAAMIDDFCHAATLSALFPELYAKILIDGKNVSDFFEEFAPIIADFEESLKNGDTVTVGDLCEYEISPKLNLIADSIDSMLK